MRLFPQITKYLPPSLTMRPELVAVLVGVVEFEGVGGGVGSLTGAVPVGGTVPELPGMNFFGMTLGLQPRDKVIDYFVSDARTRITGNAAVSVNSNRDNSVFCCVFPNWTAALPTKGIDIVKKSSGGNALNGTLVKVLKISLLSVCGIARDFQNYVDEFSICE